jgi:hypothetical protein
MNMKKIKIIKMMNLFHNYKFITLIIIINQIINVYDIRNNSKYYINCDYILYILMSFNCISFIYIFI